MKRYSPLILILALCLTLGSLSGCSGKAADTPMGNSMFASDSYEYADAAAEEEAMYEMEAPAAAPAEPEEAAAMGMETGNAADPTSLTSSAEQFAEKIIYSGSATVETTDFDQSVENVYRMVSDFGGFLESSSLSGKDYHSSYYNNNAYRSADFVIRIPKENFSAMQDNLSALGYVVRTRSWTENITAQYMDTESRLNAYRTEEASLLELLEKAETVEDMITVQSRLSDVRYEIESLTSTLRYYQTQVDYSTFTLTLNEVVKIVEPTETPVTYGGEIKQAFLDGINFVGESLGWLGKALAALIPALILPAILIIVLIVVLRRTKARRMEKLRKAYEMRQQSAPVQEAPSSEDQPQQ